MKTMNKKVKITDYTRKGKKTRYEYIHLTKWQVFKNKVKVFFKRLFWCIVIELACWGIFKAGGYANPSIIYTKAEVIKEIEIKAPILERIAKCESPTGHYGKNGQVVVRGNDNHTVDIGKYQINSYYWGAKATELGLNIWVEKDNEAMANYIYKNYGTSPWVSSSKCWQ